MSSSPSFLDQVASGNALPQEIDDYIERWHGGAGTGELRTFLGMTPEEYAAWVRDPGTLDDICQARIHAQPVPSR